LSISQVAFDRYYRICRLGQQFSVPKAKALCLMSVILGILTSWPTCLIFGRKTLNLHVLGPRTLVRMRTGSTGSEAGSDDDGDDDGDDVSEAVAAAEALPLTGAREDESAGGFRLETGEKKKKQQQHDSNEIHMHKKYSIVVQPLPPHDSMDL
jgi:hypothetical protein